MLGTVKWFNEDKGFGFIEIENEKQDYFVHYKEIAGTGYKTLEQGAKVEFEPARGNKGLLAKNVHTIHS